MRLGVIAILCLGSILATCEPIFAALPVTGEVNFDNSAVRAKSSEAPLAEAPAHTKAEKAAFWSTWGLARAAFAADSVTTVMVIDRGGREMDPAFTVFGERNVAGILALSVAAHLALAGLSWYLYNEASKHEGLYRDLLMGSAIVVNIAGIVGNAYFGAWHNAQQI